ncbi:MAG: iron-sulfur cluster assembly protein, partial [Mesorhizobium sp.]
MATASVSGSREEEVWRRLGEVNDPELDEAITEMGFVERAEITSDGTVEVDFRLPTYWCSPNFAFLMLDGVRKALDRLS